MQALYSAEIDKVTRAQWERLLLEYEDATIFQTWAYGAARWGEHNLSHAVIRKGGAVAGLAQVVLVRAPIVGQVNAFVVCGPLWQRSEGTKSAEDLLDALEALRAEYALRRRLCLRVRPWPYDVTRPLGDEILSRQGWSHAHSLSSTYILDLTPSEDALRRAMDKKWRANLRKAEQSELSVVQQDLDAGIRLFETIHHEMRERKRFTSEFMGALPRMFEGLPEALQPRFFVCMHKGTAVAAAIVAAYGKRAFYLNGASSAASLELRGGYFLQWAIVRWLKNERGCRWYDLHGAHSSPGVHQFKKGLVGNPTPEVPVIEYEACESRLAGFIVRTGYRLRKRRSGA